MEGQIQVHILLIHWKQTFVNVYPTKRDAIDAYIQELKNDQPVHLDIVENLRNVDHMPEDTRTRNEMDKAFHGQSYDPDCIDLDFFFEKNDEDTSYHVRTMDFSIKRLRSK